MFKTTKTILVSLKRSIIFIIKLILAIINAAFLLIFKSIDLLFNKFKFSISFKINLLYSLLFIILLSIFFYGSSEVFRYYVLTHSNLDAPSLIDLYISGLHAFIPVLIIIFFFIGIHLSKKMLKPLQDMTESVKNINGNDLNARLDTNRAKDELKDLAITFNEMMDRIQVFVERQKQFVSDASHELRTPIAIIQGYSEMLSRWGTEDPKVLEESILSISEETANMKDLLEKLLFLSRSDKNTLKVEMKTFNLSTLCQDVLKQTSFIDDEHELIPKIDKQIMLYGDEALIKELLRILIDNALKYTPEGGSITLSCTTTKQNIILSIKDTGIGIPKEHIPHLFERFYRVDEARNKNTGGNGLGLAIADQIVKTHNAKIFVNSEVNEGTEFIIFLPLL